MEPTTVFTSHSNCLQVLQGCSVLILLLKRSRLIHLTLKWVKKFWVSVPPARTKSWGEYCLGIYPAITGLCHYRPALSPLLQFAPALRHHPLFLQLWWISPSFNSSHRAIVTENTHGNWIFSNFWERKCQRSCKISHINLYCYYRR